MLVEAGVTEHTDRLPSGVRGEEGRVTEESGKNELLKLAVEAGQVHNIRHEMRRVRTRIVS